MALSRWWGWLTGRRSKRPGSGWRRHRPHAFSRRMLPLRLELLEERLAPNGTPLQFAIAPNHPAELTLRLSGAELQIVKSDDPGAAPLATKALADTSSISIVG